MVPLRAQYKFGTQRMIWIEESTSSGYAETRWEYELFPVANGDEDDGYYLHCYGYRDGNQCALYVHSDDISLMESGFLR